MSRRVHPLVEAITSDRYEVEEGRGSVDKVNKRLHVPLDDSPLALRVRVHEMAHAQLSPEVPTGPEGVEVSAIQHAEDLRMNLHAVRRGLGDVLMEGGLDVDEIRRVAHDFAFKPVLALGGAAASYKTGDHETYLEALAEFNPMAAVMARAFAPVAWAALDSEEEPAYEDTVRLAQLIHEWAEVPPGGGEGDGEGDGGEGDGQSQGGDGGGQGDGSGEARSGPGGASERGGGKGAGDATGAASAGAEGDEPAQGEPAQGEPAEGEDKGDAQQPLPTDNNSAGDPDEAWYGTGKPPGSESKGDDGEGEGGEGKGQEDGEGSQDGDGDDGPAGKDKDGAGPRDPGIAGGGPSDRAPMTGVPARPKRLPDPLTVKGWKPLSLTDLRSGMDRAITRTVKNHTERLRAVEGDAPEELNLEAGGDRLTDGARKAVDEMLAWAKSQVSPIPGTNPLPPGQLTMDVHKPTRTKRLPQRILGRKRRTSPEGRVPRHMSRYATDRAVFEDRGKKPGGGTVLVDTSGSMSMTPAQVRQIMELAPAATIAAYSENGERTHLRILAKDGLRVPDDKLRTEVAGYGGGNGDLPAIMWLTKQAKPRIWVSDGYVVPLTNSGISYTAILWTYAEAIATLSLKHDILRINHVAGTIAWFKRSKDAREARRGARQKLARAERRAAKKGKK